MSSLSLEDICVDILSRRDEEVRHENGGRYPKNNPTASDLSPCARETALGILHWQERPLFEVDLLHRFNVGHANERLGIATLMKLGIQIIESQRLLELKDADGAVLLRGKIDGMLKHPDFPEPILFDYKTIHPNQFPRIQSVKDLQDGFYAKWNRQLQAYMALLKYTTSCILLDDCLGHWKFIIVPFDAILAEDIFSNCQLAIEAVTDVRAGYPEADVLPPYYPDADTCQKCWAFGRFCTPPRSYTGMKYWEDPELDRKIETMKRLEDSAKEYHALQKEIKAQVEGHSDFITDHWHVEGKWVSRRYKAKPATPAHESQYWKVSYTPILESQNDKLRPDVTGHDATGRDQTGLDKTGRDET